MKNKDIQYGNKEANYHIHAKEGNNTIRNINRSLKTLNFDEENENNQSCFTGTQNVWQENEHSQIIKFKGKFWNITKN